jgi:hypothetical protein
LFIGERLGRLFIIGETFHGKFVGTFHGDIFSERWMVIN